MAPHMVCEHLRSGWETGFHITPAAEPGTLYCLTRVPNFSREERRSDFSPLGSIRHEATS